MSEEELRKIAIFQQKEIRKQLHNGEWWFVLVDIVTALTDSADPAQYLKRLRQRDSELAKLFDPVDKGGYKLYPPLSYLLIHLAANSNYSHGIRRVFSGLYNQYRAKRQSHSSVG
ncbi:hypothetical protein JNM87_05140 [Candidatus Saccharibacteria bacterium]|nr:hypothetical protein [Candidatus Saccharibacteria bacterium]